MYSRLAAVFLVSAVLAMGCQTAEDVDVPTTPPVSDGKAADLSRDAVEVEGYGHAVFKAFRSETQGNKGHGEIDVVFNGEQRMLVYDDVRRRDGSMSVASRVEDGSGESTWKQGMDFDMEGQLVLFYEDDGNERLEVTITRLGHTIVETYNWMGLEGGDMLQSFEYSDEAGYEAAGAAYLTWRPEKTSLGFNPDAVLLNRVTAGQVTHKILPKFEDAVQVEPIPQIPERICQIGSMCAILKCRYGGPSNIACDICIGVVIACMFCAFTGWC